MSLPMQNDTDAGSDELPAYCRGILKTCSKAITFCCTCVPQLGGRV